MCAATKFVKPLPQLPLHWLVVAATATSAPFSKSRNRYPLLRYSATATTIHIPTKTRTAEEGSQEGQSLLKLKIWGQPYHFTTPKSRKRRKENSSAGPFPVFLIIYLPLKIIKTSVTRRVKEVHLLSHKGPQLNPRGTLQVRKGR